MIDMKGRRGNCTKKVENELLFMPTNLTKGIDVSDDPILNTRTEAYGDPTAGA